jgi:hypothetical protein
MSRIGCLCGATIHDTLFPNPDKGMIIRDQEEDALFTCQAQQIAQFVTAVAAGKREEWIAERFTPQYQQLGLSDEDIVHDLLTSCFFDYTLDMLQCEHCGRLRIQEAHGVNSYHSFHPDDMGKDVRALLHEEHRTATSNGNQPAT